MRPTPLLALMLAAGLLLAGCEDDNGGGGGGKKGGLRTVKQGPNQCGRSVESQKCEIDLYCQYGAVSRAQLEGCEDNVKWGQFKFSNTNAARFARLELDKCLADAGPFCHASAAEPDYDYP